MDRVELFLEQKTFMNGIVIPWFGSTYGCDIGYSESKFYPAGKGGEEACRFSEQVVRNTFQSCLDMGFNVARIWLFETMEGILFDEKGYARGVQPIFRQNLIKICEIARQMGQPLIVTFQSHISYSVPVEKYPFFTRILFEKEFTEGYIRNVLTVLAKELREFDNILMYDVYAEPEGDVRGPQGNNTDQYGGTWTQLRYYIQRSVQTLKAISPEVPVTACAGWRKYETLREGRYNGLGLDYIGLDMYNDTGELEPAHTLGVERPVWLAEYGPEIKDNWDDDFQIRLVESFLHNACKQGYIGAFFWHYGHCSSSEALSLVGRNGKLRKIAGELPRIFKEVREEARAACPRQMAAQQ